MKKFIFLILNSLAYTMYALSFSLNAQQITEDTQADIALQQETFNWSTLKKTWEDDIQFHGFFSQGLFHSTGNNVYGKSKDSVSADLTEIGLNMSYQALNNLSFAAQGLYRRAGASTGDAGEVTLDFAFADITFLSFSQGRLGVRGGRIKNPWGFYNETRDVASTHPTIFLPLIYFERSRALLIAIDGGQLYADYSSPIGDFLFTFNYGYSHDNKELLLAITSDPDVSGKLDSDPGFMTQLHYEIMGGQYAFAISYADLNSSYTSSKSFDPYTGLESNIDSLMLSAQYNGEKFSLVGEYNIQWNSFSFPQAGADFSPVSEYWYIQASYRFLDNLQMTIRYDSSSQDKSDRSGKNFHAATGLPAHLMYTQDAVIGLRWDITPSWMLRAEYQRVHGASTVSLLDNPDLSKLVKDWNIYALQVSFRF
ncbi:MAG: hypothetical protein GQ582_08550 [Methyloprofundus sp.]|nr:hypothetical protein [Methyloprofundus sp.]